MGIDAHMVFTPTQSEKHTGSAKHIIGESSDVGATTKSGEKLGSFEIISFEWGASAVKKDKAAKKQPQQNAPGVPGGGISDLGQTESTSHRVVNVGSFKISKPFDSASLGMFNACIDTECVFKEATVLFRKMAGGKHFVYLKFVFGQVRIDSIDWKMESTDSTDKPDQEDVHFSFQTCDIFYSPQSETGEKESRWGKTEKKSASFSRSAGDDAD